MAPSRSTIVKAFSEKLPNATLASNDPYRPIRSTVASTINRNAVRAYLEESIETYDKLCNRYLPAARFLSSTMPEVEQTHRLETEADVIRLSTLQLLHPVNIALQQISPPGTRLFCRSEAHSKTPASCFDVDWSLYDSEGNLLSTVAILEFKNTHVIHKNDFQGGAAVDEKQLEAMAASALDRGSRKHRSFLQKNAVWLSKQARKYSAKSPYVAVFDWNAMFLFSFLPDKVRGLYFDESGHTDGMTFRRLLFAFVARALEEYKK